MAHAPCVRSSQPHVGSPAPALADVAGTASVIDGDTIEVHGQRIRLHGIDAPESRHLCRLDSKPWQCEMVTGPGFSSPNQPDQERTTAYRDSAGPNSRSDAHFATIFGDCEEPSGESRFNGNSGALSSRPVDRDTRLVLSSVIEKIVEEQRS